MPRPRRSSRTLAGLLVVLGIFAALLLFMGWGALLVEAGV
jgi:hypothetical protein